MILICISLMISSIEHYFHVPLATCMSSLEKCLFWWSAHFFFFLWHVEAPRLGVESELQLSAYVTATALQQHHIRNPLNEARDQSHILMETYVGFLTY